MTENRESQDVRPDEVTEEEPQVYSVHKGLTGWKFSRREFLTAAATAATAAAVGTGDKSGTVTAQPVQILDDPTDLEVTDLRPGQEFTKVWQFKNNSDSAWGDGKELYLVGGDEMRAPASVAVPNAAPGEIVSISVDLVAPSEPGFYQINWYFPITDTLAYTSYLPIVIREFVPTPTPTHTPPPPACLAESPHPYDNNMDQTWVVINPDPAAQGTRVHFSRVETYSEPDFIILRDGTGQEYQRISGSYPTGLWSNPLPGREVRVRFVTSSVFTDWGFCLDRVETTARPPTPMPPTPTATRRPCSCRGNTHYWYPN